MSSSCSKSCGQLQMISSPLLFRYQLSKFATIVQASQECCWTAGHSQAMTVILEKATAPRFSFQSSRKPWKAHPTCSRKEESARRKPEHPLPQIRRGCCLLGLLEGVIRTICCLQCVTVVNHSYCLLSPQQQPAARFIIFLLVMPPLSHIPHPPPFPCAWACN